MCSLTTFPTDHHFWLFLAHCAGTGGSILIIGSAAGISVMGTDGTTLWATPAPEGASSRRPAGFRTADSCCYEYQSDFARKYYSPGLAKGLAKGRSGAKRRSILALVNARLPRQTRLREERALREQPEAALVQLFDKLAKAPDKDGVRAVIERFLERRS